MTSGSVLGMRFPPEIDASTCTPVDEEIEPPNIEEKFDRWSEIKDFTSEIGDDAWINTFGYRYRCKNLAVTKLTSNFEFGVFEAGGTKMIMGEAKARSEIGIPFDSKSSVYCDKTCPLCVSSCTITIVRKITQEFRTITIESRLLYFDNFICKYRESGHNFGSTCVMIDGGITYKVKVVLRLPRGASSMTVNNVLIRYPQLSSNQSFPFLVRTYAGRDVDPLALIEDGYIGGITGKCEYPCDSCSGDPRMCDKCAEDFMYNRDLYLYPNGTELCDLQADTNCRELEDGKCCNGYYLDEENRQCLKCGEGCVLCKDVENCIRCFDQSNFYYKGECREECPEGYYHSGRNCMQCDANCKACNTEKVCTKCHDDHILYDKEATCIAKCPKGTGFVNGGCELCGEDCDNCTGWPLKCTKCAEDTYVRKFLLPEVDECVTAEECENGKRAVNNRDATCIPCASACEECKGSPDHCSKCKSWEHLHVTKSTCVPGCGPYDYKAPSSDGTNDLCVSCEGDCLLCKSESDCIVCKDDKLFVPATKQCVEACPWKHYESHGKCYPCNELCVRCDNPMYSALIPCLLYTSPSPRD
eukprot:TRINITY_DN8888_c0_g2_i3.p1 TRINITY_DN8888_c0_g2~~TRINITY_DN8888_c0_g2_i3.p1  ORF type:complete len:585 (-),score=111.26 TRINITY_DN8888_c0_g2_i3:53-1807(-)